MGSTRQDRARAVETLRKVALFDGCTDDELARIDRLFTEVRVAPDRVVMSRGSSALQFVVVREGYARVTSEGEDIGRVGPGSHIGERALVGATWRARIVALTEMRVLVMNAGELASMLHEVPSLRERIEHARSERPASTALRETRLARA